MFRTSFPYEYDVAVLKKYGNLYKLCKHKILREKGWELVSDKSDESQIEKGSVNSQKLLCNLRRTKNTIFELSMCNDWDLFCTFTLDPAKYNRNDLAKFRSDFTLMIRHLRSKYDCFIAYLLIPERHKNGAWHMHGFIQGLPDDELRCFTLDEKLPKYIRQKLKKGAIVYEWTSYRRKFGYCDLELIKDKERASSYVTKYITKDLLESVTELNHKSYYCSQGLNRAIEIKRGHVAVCPQFDYEDEYVSIKWYRDGDILPTFLE